MHDAIYFPIHRAKHLSPYALTRVRPTFEVQKPGDEDDMPLHEYLGSVAFDLSESWDHRYPLFADFAHFTPEDRTPDGRHCVEYFFRCLRRYGMLAIPMTGSESMRGPGHAYLEAVAAIAQADGRGAAIRLPADELNDRVKLQHTLEDTLQVLRLGPALVGSVLRSGDDCFLAAAVSIHGRSRFALAGTSSYGGSRRVP